MVFYIQEYSQREIAAFLKLRLTAVNNRLHAARKFLKRRMLAVIKDAVKQNALSDTFAEKVGRVMQVRGPVIEAEFAQNDLPEILCELTITDAPRGIKAKVEVAQHGRDGRVRCIATSPIKGLQRGMKITATGKAIATPLNSASIKRAVRLLSPRIKTKGNVEDLAIAEHRAGRHEIDILGSSAVTFLSLKEAGVVRPYISLETGAFRGGMRDPQGYWVSEYSNVLAIICNKNRVKNPPRDWQDFTDRRWKGDFSIDTERFQWFGALQKIYGGEAAKQLMLAYKQNGALVRRGGTLQVQLVAAGEYSCTPGAYLNSAYLLKEKGAPLNYSVPEPVMLSPSITMMPRFPPDPYAAMLFYDYSISPEGMSHFTRNNALFPSRQNVPVVDDIKALEGKRLHFIEVEEENRRYKEISEIYQAVVEK